MKKTFQKIVSAFLIALATVVTVYFCLNFLCGNSMGQTLSFVSRAILEPRRIGAVAPSSQYLAQALCAKVPPASAGPRCILEVGAGSGIVTDCLVSQLTEKDHLDVVELDPELAQDLTQKYAHLKNVQVHACSITDFSPGIEYDAIVMGVPFSILPYQVVSDIWQHCHHLAKKGSIISYFSYLMFPHLRPLFADDADQHEFYKVQVFMRDQMEKNGAGSVDVFANVPPARALYIKA